MEKILTITGELKRVLKKTGQFWLNFGDCYGGSNNGSNDYREEKGISSVPLSSRGPGAKRLKYWGGNVEKSTLTNPERQQEMGRAGNSKCMLMMPERIAIEMIDNQGWILRNRVCWAKQVYLFKEKKTKGSVMPSSVKDRFNESWEYLYFFVKNKKYYSDLDAVRLPNQVLGITDFRASGLVRSAELYPNSKYANADNEGKIDGRVLKHIKSLEVRMEDTHNGKASKNEIEKYKKETGKIKGGGANMNLPWNPITGGKIYNRNKVNDPRGNHEGGPGSWRDFKDQNPNDGNEFNPIGKNLPTVWLIGSEPHNFSNELDGIDTDHFAIFPQALVEIPIKFGTKPGDIVLDPFMGSGTTAIVARKLGRRWVGIELNEKYIEIANKRMAQEVLF